MDNPALWYKTQVATQVTHRFRSSGYALKDTLRKGEHIGGDKFKFYFSARGEATKRAASGKYNYQNNKTSNRELAAETYEYATKVRTDDVRRMSVAAVDATSKAAGDGCASTANKIVLAGMTTAVVGTGDYDILAANDLGNAATDFRISHMLLMSERFGALGIPKDGNIWCPIPARCWTIANMSDLFANANYVGPEVASLAGRRIRTFHDVNYIEFPDEFFGAAGDASFVLHAYHGEAVGAAVMDDGEVRTDMQKISDEPAFSLVSEFDMAVGLLQGNGVVRLTVNRTSTYPTATTVL
jgi:hypothetical protein